MKAFIIVIVDFPAALSRQEFFLWCQIRCLMNFAFKALVLF